MPVLDDGQYDIHLQILLRGQWVEMAAFLVVIGDVYTEVYHDRYGGDLVWNYNRLVSDSITITHGRADETSDPQPTQVSFRLRNDDGQLSPDNPESDWWPDVNKGASVRIMVGDAVALWAEIASINPVWPDGDAGGPCYVDITANGILRRLGQGENILRSPLYRAILAKYPHVTDHWSMEEGSDSSSFASSLGGYPVQATGMSLGSDETLAGAEDLPIVSQGQSGSWGAGVVGHAGAWRLEGFLHIPVSPPDTDSSITYYVYSSGTVSTWRIIIGNTGSGTDPGFEYKRYISLTAYASDGTVLAAQQFVSPKFLFGPFAQLALAVTDIGGGHVGWQLAWALVSTGVDTVEALTGTATGTAGRPYFVRCNVVNAPSDVAFGHHLFQDNTIAGGWTSPADVGYAGEQALSRMRRLSTEEGHPFTYVNPPGRPTAAMGAQKPQTYLDLMLEAAASDGGILAEQRTALGLIYRTVKSRYNEPVGLTLDAALSQIDNPFAPTTDDQAFRNKITATRIDGGKAIAIDTRSAANPPAGDGLYEATVDLSLFTDTQLRDQAGWRKHLLSASSKTRDLPAGQKLRYSQVTFSLGKSPELVPTWLARTAGDRVQVLNPPAQHPHEVPIDLVLQGWTETIDPYDWVVVANTTPWAPWVVARWGDPYCSGERSTLSAAIDATQTSITVVTTGSTVWTTTNLPLQIRVGGLELMTITAISAAVGGVQTFTVVRNVNGFARPLPAGSTVHLFPNPVLGL